METSDTLNGYPSYVPLVQVREPAALAISWLDWLLSVKGRSHRTIDSYGVIVRQWFQWCDRYAVDPLTPALDDLEGFVTRPRTRQAHGAIGSPATRRADVMVLRSWFGWLHKRGHLRVDPTGDLEAPTVKARQPKPVPDNDWLTLWASVKPGTRLHVALGLGYFCGLRRAELSSLTGDQITDETIVSFTRKGGGEDSLPWRSMLAVYVERLPHLVPRADVWASELMRWAGNAGPDRILWTEGQQFYKSMVKLAHQAGCAVYTPHQLWHSCATNLLRAQVPPHLVMSLMNHSSFDMTRRYMKAGGTELDEWRRLKLRA